MRIPIDPEFAAAAKEKGLPIFRVQIDWRYVPQEKRHLKSHECCGYTTVECASKLLRFAYEELERAVSEAESGAASPKAGGGK